MIILATYFTENAIQFSLTGVHFDFLSHTIDLNTKGNVVPSWLAYPDYSAITSG